MDDQVRQDALLVVRAQLGDRLALAELVGRWHDPVRSYARRMIEAPATADDVSQEAWVAALKALPRLRDPMRFAPWLFTIARRAIVNHLRDKYQKMEPERDEPVGDDVAGAVLDRAEVSDGLAGLPAAERDVLILFYLQDLSLDDCAQILDIPPGTVKSRLNRARRLLRQQLTDKGYAP